MDSARKRKKLEVDQTPSFKGRISKNYSSGGEKEFLKWIQSVDKTLGLLRSRPRDASTYRVPSKLRAMKHEAYTPQMVSIGPFHQRKDELRAMEELKWIYMSAFVDRAVISDKDYTQVKEFENQIPYFVLQKLFDLISSSKTAFNGVYPDMSLEDYVFWFFHSIPMLRFNYLKVFINNGDGAYKHLLDMLYHVCKVTFVPNLPYKPVPKSWGFTRCATELFRSGFQIARGYRSIVDIRFIGGILFIPQVFIDKSSDTIFRNLIALEQTSVGRYTVTSYVKLMNTLIRSPEDANLLERLGIIIKADDIEDISTFFKSLCSQVPSVDFCYAALCDEVEKYQIPFWRWHRVKGYLSIKFVEWKASIKDLKQDYFKTKWSFLAFLAASFVILLAIVQTFYTVRAYYPPYH